MQADFLDAHTRHWDDAETLFTNGRYANASHLYGMAAECGLKRLMIEFGMNVNSHNGAPDDNKDWKHADGIWARYEDYRKGRTEGTGYALTNPSPFTGWHVSDRYAHQSNFNQAMVQAHRNGADAIRQLIAKAEREGLI